MVIFMIVLFIYKYITMRVFLYVLVLMFVASCAPSLRYYTKEIHDDSRWSASELRKIQFYLSGDIILWRDINMGESVITNGKIKMVDGRKVEEVIIRRGTPGVFLFSPSKNHYAISFDPESDAKYLVFGPSDKAGERYVLLAKEWGKRYGKVTYGDKIYRTPAESAFAFLMVNVTKTQTTNVKSERPSGRRVDN